MNKIEVKKLPKSEVLLIVEVDPEKLEVYETETARRVSEKMDIPGFRRGQAPKAFVISQLGPDNFFQEVLNIALPQSYFEAVQEHKLPVISRPEVKITSRSPLKYEARSALMPEVLLKNHDKIKVPQQPVVIGDTELDEVVEEMRRYRATYKPLNREVKKGDRVELDFQGYDEGGAALDKTQSKNHPLFVGEGSMVPGFEEALIGMKVGEKKKFPVTFPKDFHYEPLRSKVVHFEAEIKKGEEAELPQVDETFVEQIMGMKKTPAEFKQALKTDMEIRKKIEARQKRENELLEKLLSEAKLEVSPLLLDEEVDYMVQDFERELKQRNLTLESYLEKLKKDPVKFRKEHEPEAEKRVKIRLILNYLFGELKIEVSDSEVQQAVDRLLERTQEEQRPALLENVKKKGDVYLRLKNNLMLEKLFIKFLGE